jgi:hypothetical protein
MGTKTSVMGSNAGPAIASAQAGQVTVQRGNKELLATDSEDATLRLRLVKLPAQHRIVSVVLENDDLDGGATGTIDIGVEDSVQDPVDTTNATLIGAAVSVQAAAVVRYETQVMLEFGVTNYDRFIIVDIDVASTTGLVGGIAATLTSRPELGAQFEN